MKCFDLFSFHTAFVLCVGLLSLVEVVCGRYRRNSSASVYNSDVLHDIQCGQQRKLVLLVLLLHVVKTCLSDSVIIRGSNTMMRRCETER